MIQQSQVIEMLVRRFKEKEGGMGGGQLQGMVGQVVSEKLKHFGEGVARQLKQIGGALQMNYDLKTLEGRVMGEVEQLKRNTLEMMDTWKRKSNAYWQKVKDALGKLSGKVAGCEKDLMDLNVRVENVIAERQEERRVVGALQNSRPLMNNLVQLKKSVDNIYANYQAVLQLQSRLKGQVEQGEWEEGWSQAGAGLALGHKESLVALEYSREEGRPQEEWPSENQGNSTQPIVSPLRHHPTGSVEFLPATRTPHGTSDSSFSLNTSHYPRSQNSTVLLNLSL